MTPPPIARRVKRRIVGREHEFFAICPVGLRVMCQKELFALGRQIHDIRIHPGGVAFRARLRDACLANRMLGSPVRILMRIARFRADRFSILEKKLTAIDWELFLPTRAEVGIQAVTHRSRLYHTGAIIQRCEPILQSALDNGGAPPVHPDEIPGQTLMIRAEDNQFHISLDMSGPPLYKRGIKQAVAEAPLRENLAFAVLALAGFTPDDLLVDPMCGAGTFSFEGAMIQARIPPGFLRRFAFESWPGFSPAAFAHAASQAAAGFRPVGRIFASDMSSRAVDIASRNRTSHPFLQPIQIRQYNFFDLSPDRLGSDKGVVVLNPPYGRRLKNDGKPARLYREITRKLALDFPGWRVGLVFPGNVLRQHNPLRLRLMPLVHGGLDLVAGVGVIGRPQ